MREGSRGAGAEGHRGYEAFFLQYCIVNQGKKQRFSPVSELPKVNHYPR